MICIGFYWDLFLLGINLDFKRLECMIKLLILVEIGLVFLLRLLLRKMVMGMFLFFYDLRSGLNILVNMKGVEDSLNGRM